MDDASGAATKPAHGRRVPIRRRSHAALCSAAMHSTPRGTLGLDRIRSTVQLNGIASVMAVLALSHFVSRLFVIVHRAIVAMLAIAQVLVAMIAEVEPFPICMRVAAGL